MKILGIIAEYNPFHNGHNYQIQKAKQITNADAIVVIMSGNFVQRGEPAILDKWTRTHMALCSGADIVIELPVIYATASAEYFAYAAVKLFHDMGIITDICFGSELGEIVPLQQIAKLLLQETEQFRNILKQQLQNGVSYASARAIALSKIYPNSEALLSQPNNILAIEYLKALLKLDSHISPHTIARKNSDYNSIALSHQNMASASALRNTIAQNNIKQISHYMPSECYNILCESILQGKAPIFWEQFTPALHYCIRNKTPEEIKNIFEVTEGLENRIYKAFHTQYELKDIIYFIKTKRYTQTHIQRILLHILLQIQKKEILYFNDTGYCPYIRVLGFRRKQQHILSLLKKQSSLPLLTNLKQYQTILDKKGQYLLSLETKSTDIYFMVSPNKIYRRIHQDFIQPMVMISSV